MPSNKLLKQFDTKQTRFRSNWLRNATKSVGITMSNVLSDVAPNTVEIASTSNEIARSVVQTLTRGRSGIGKVDDSLGNVSKIGKTAIQNAMNSIRTGKFGDGGDFGFMDMGGGEDSGFSFGDDDADSSVGAASLAGLSSLSDQINRQSIAQIKTAQANMDTMISINSARMYQTQQISGEILSHITNMENSLASIVQFNNETMLKFVQASMGYYEKTGAAIAGEKKEEFELPEFRHSNVLNNRHGGINSAKYKEYIKKNIQKKLDESGMGLVLDETTLQMLAADPIDAAAQIAGSALINKFAGSTIKGIEDRLSSALPNALMSLTKLSDSNNPVLKMIGDIFGLKSEEKRSTLKDIKIAKGPIPFDGETKHAITSVITHELRNQTGYLKILADKAVRGDSDAKMKSNREFFNERTGRFERGTDIDFNIAKSIEESVTEAFKNTKFGTDLIGFTSNIDNTNDRKEMERAIDDMYMAIMNSDTDNLTVGQIINIIQSLGASGKAKKLLMDKIKAMGDQNKTNFMSVATGKLRAREAYNDRIKDLRENGSAYYLEESGMMGLEGEELEKYIADTLKRGKGEYGKIQAAGLIRITQDPDYFEQLRREGKLNGVLSKVDKATVADYNNLVKKGTKAADKKYQEIKNQIMNGTDYKNAVGAVKGGAAAVAGSARDKFSEIASDLGGGISDLVSRGRGGLISRTGMISRFIFGDQTKGTKGLFDSIADSFNKGLKQADPKLEMTDGKKAITMGGVGALTGAALAKFGFLPAILAGSGPIGGAVAGLTLAIAGAGPMFKKALFGGDVEEFEDDKGNKYTHKTKGLVGRIGTTLEVNLINPVKTAAINAIQTTALNVEHGILIPFKYLASFTAKTLARTAGKVFNGVGKLIGAFGDENSLINRLTGGLFKTGTKALGGAISGGINLATNVGGAMMNAPGNILGAALSILDPELAAEFDTERAGNKSRRKALKELNKNKKKHDKNAQIIAKFTNGEYGEDSDEARAYLKKHNPKAYEKYFGEGSGNIGTIDEEKGIRKLINESGGKNITIDPSQYDPMSQTAIYSARMVIMQEQLLRAFLGEKVEYSANSDATLSKGGHEQKSDKQAKKDAKKAASKKWQEKTKNKFANNEQLTEEEQAYIDKLSDEEKEELKFQQNINGRRSWVKSHIAGENSLWNRIRARFEQGRITRDLERHEGETLGLRPKKTKTVEDGGEGFGRFKLYGGHGPFSKTIEDIKEERKEKEDTKWKKDILNAVKGVKAETREHKEGWASIFSKKGLITGALILLAPLIIKNLPKIISFLKDTGPMLMEGIGAAVTGIASGVKVIADMFGGSKDGGDLTNGNNLVENATEIADRGYANLLPMRNGEIDNTSSAKAGALLNLGRIAAHADDYAKLSKAPKILTKLPGVKWAAKNHNANIAIGKVFSGIKHAPENISKLVNKNTLKSVATNYGDDVMDSAVDLMAKAQAEGLEAVAKSSASVSSVAGNGGLFNKVKGFISKFYDDILGKFTKKFGSTAPSLKAFAKEKLIDFCQKHFGKIGTKISEKLAAGSATGTATLGLSELAFATLGAINGVTGAAKLFHVPSDSVDGTMRAISGLFGGLAGTTVGGVLDVIFQIIYQISGVDFLCGIATALYTGAKKLAGKTEDIEKLGKAQAALNEEYDEYKNTEIKKSYETQLKAGLIPEGTSFEEFLAGVQDGTYKATYDSQADYIAKNHGALSDKIMKGLGKGWKALKKGVGGALSLTIGSIDTTYTDSNGNTYKKNENGNYDIITAEGENVGEITKDMIPNDAVKKTKFSTGISNRITLGKQFIQKLASSDKTKNTVLGKAANALISTKKKVDTFWDNVKEGGINFIKNKVDKYIIYRPIDNPLSYYMYNNKNGFDWYNQNGEIIEENAKTYDEMMSLYSNGLVTRDKTTAGIKTSISTTAKNKIETIGNTIADVWKKGTSAISGALDKLKNAVGIETKDAEISTEKTEGGQGGRGAFYSQNDPRWKNSSYGSDATMGDSGCGPTAVAMAMSDATGRRFNPMQMAGLAQATGDRDATGTNWNFVNNAAALAGVPSRQVYSPSADYIGSELAAGNELILSGRTGGYGRGGYGSAYTPAGHYIVGTGIDRNGIVSYKDPTTGGMGRIPLHLLTSETGSSWRLGGRGPAALEAGNIGTDYSAPVAASKQSSTTSTTKSQSSTKNTGWIGNRTIDTSGTDSLNYRPDDAYNQTSSKEAEAEYKRWLETVAYVKKYASGKQPTYSQSAYVTIELPDGRKIKMRTDCSGFVSCCLDAYGAFKPGTVINSSGFNNSKHVAMSNTGFVPMAWPGWDKLSTGDIIATNGHVEIFAENDGSKHKVWNWGSNASAADPGMTSSSHKSYTTVWKHPAAANGASMSPSDITGDLSSSNSGDATISGSSKSMGVWDKITGAVSDFFGEAFNRLLTGNKSTDYSDIWNKYRDTDEEGNPIIGSGYNSYKSTFGTTGSTTGETESGTTSSGSTYSGEPMSYSGTPVKNYSEAQAALEGLGLSDTKKNFYAKILNGSLQTKRDYNVLPSISMAQAWIESSNKHGPGMSGLTQKANNLFGIKASKGWTGGTVTMSTAEYDKNGNKYYVDAPFRSYASWDDSIIDHGKFLQTKRYTDVRNATNYVDAANALQSAGYATSPTYASSLIDKIETDKLYTFDTYGGAGKGISIHNRQYLPTTKRPVSGGRGLSFTTSTTGYNGPSYSTVYGTKQPVSSTEKLMYQIIDIITNIANIESGASDKLDLLNNIGNTSNNVIVAGNGGGEQSNLKTASQHMGNQASSRNFKQAHRMAMQRETVNM